MGHMIVQGTEALALLEALWKHEKDAVSKLTNVQKLDLRGTQISALPPEIGQLTNLQSLDLGWTPISTFPAEIGQLTNLQSLDLGWTQISTFPAEIGHSQICKVLIYVEPRFRLSQR